MGFGLPVVIVLATAGTSYLSRQRTSTAPDHAVTLQRILETGSAHPGLLVSHLRVPQRRSAPWQV